MGLFAGDSDNSKTVNKTITKTNANNYSSDSFGLGSAFSGIFSGMSQGTNECGSRPICLTNGENCTTKLKTYNDCVSKSIDANSEIQRNKSRMMIFAIIGGGNRSCSTHQSFKR